MSRIQVLGLVESPIVDEDIAASEEKSAGESEAPFRFGRDRDSSYRRRRGKALLAAASFHAVALSLLVFISPSGPEAGVGLPVDPPPRLVFLATPGPGGGGGGGGRSEKRPASVFRRQGRNLLQAPLPARAPPPPTSPNPVVEKTELEKAGLQVDAVPHPAGSSDQRGEIEAAEDLPESSGPGVGEGAGTGQGTGMGPGTGSGLGPGWGGGTGGGPYRPGSGVTMPVLIRQIMPNYTEEALRQKIQGEVLLEVVISRDGRIFDARVIRSLDQGLDRKALEAVRQWTFVPGKLRGEPVDVLAWVAVKFEII